MRLFFSVEEISLLFERVEKTSESLLIFGCFPKGESGLRKSATSEIEPIALSSPFG